MVPREPTKIVGTDRFWAASLGGFLPTPEALANATDVAIAPVRSSATASFSFLDFMTPPLWKFHGK
jgi:hypothetical protein